MQEIATRTVNVPAELQEKALLGGDLAKLTPAERLSFYNAVCTSVGLNPLTRPFEYLNLKDDKGQDKMILYARKDCTDQLRDLHGISVEIVSREVIDGVCVVTARAKNMTERTDESLGAVPFMKENGEWKTAHSGKPYFKGDGTYQPLGLAERSNAMMKAETKAKRRVTLSICGLGMFDESEIDTMPEAKRLFHAESEKPVTPAEILERVAEPTEIGQGDNDLADGGPPERANRTAANPNLTLQDAPVPFQPLPFQDACDRLSIAQSPKEIAEVMNASLNANYTTEERQTLTKTKDQAMKRLGKK
jgi:hypothetical protein